MEAGTTAQTTFALELTFENREDALVVARALGREANRLDKAFKHATPDAPIRHEIAILREQAVRAAEKAMFPAEVS